MPTYKCLELNLRSFLILVSLSTSGADGLLKLWTIKNNECVKTLDAHDNKVWALHANKKDDTLVTGSTDSRVLVWKVEPAKLADLKFPILAWLICFTFFFFLFLIFIILLIRLP